MIKYFLPLAFMCSMVIGMEQEEKPKEETKLYKACSSLYLKGKHVLSFDWAEKGMLDGVELAQFEYDNRYVTNGCKKKFGKQCPKISCAMCGVGAVCCCVYGYVTCPEYTVPAMICTLLCCRKVKEEWNKKRGIGSDEGPKLKVMKRE